MANTALLQNDKPKGNGAEAPALRVPFVRASRERVEMAYDQTHTNFGASSVPSPPVPVPASGFLRHLVIHVRATGGDGATTAAVASEDAPFSILSDVQLADVNGNPMFGPLSGFQAYLAGKFGGYSGVNDAKRLPSFSGVDAGGNFTFTLRIPVEVSARDAFGALANMNASQTYKLRYTLAPASQVYTTEPNALPSEVQVTAWLETWSPPRESDPEGIPNETRPKQHGATQYWQPSVYNLSAGEQTIRLSRVGNLIRTLVVIAHDTNGDRTTADFPDPIRVEYDGTLVESVGRSIIRDRMASQYDLTGAAEAAGGLDNGVFVWSFAHDLDGLHGFETRDGYLPTSAATRLDLRGAFGASIDTLTVLTNDIAIPQGV